MGFPVSSQPFVHTGHIHHKKAVGPFSIMKVTLPKLLLFGSSSTSFFSFKIYHVSDILSHFDACSTFRLGMDGIKILNLVIPKPDIPPDIVSNYKAVKVQWTEQLVATQLQRTEQIRKETESMKAVADANRQKAVLQIELQKQVLMKEGEKDVSLLDNEIVRKREESNADVEAYKKIKDAEGNAVLFTKEYVQLEMAKALSNNTKYFFSGEQSVLGALLNRVLGKDSET